MNAPPARAHLHAVGLERDGPDARREVVAETPSPRTTAATSRFAMLTLCVTITGSSGGNRAAIERRTITVRVARNC
jgi:hypothetical protein